MADIAERGQLQPSVLDTQGRILDGRNRHAACELVSVEPKYTTYAGDDPDGYALAVNIARRHLTKGQQAIVISRSLLVSNQNQRSLAGAFNVSQTRISQARSVLEFAPDLADQVADGTKPLDAAYKTAQERKRGADGVSGV